MTLCPYTMMGCDMNCKAYQNATCPFDAKAPPKPPKEPSIFFCKHCGKQFSRELFYIRHEKGCGKKG